ncbi:MAG: response regulator receiver modulated diguanylate cyclase [Firmicutes bacterium]|nr:response regulator receiver modulated diguanylate cyclase [Bacillota bacterium]
MPKILIVDDSPLEIKIIRKFLGNENEYEIIEAGDGKAAIDLAKAAMPDLILMDIIMPGMDGLSVCKALRSQPATADIPVIFITAVSDSKDIVKGFEAGGQDYITKPFHSHELCARVKVHLDLKKSKEALLEYAQEMEIKNKELSELMVQLENSAMTDFLTGMANRRQMMQRIKAEISGMKRNGGKATLIMADIDDFKKINDTYGHDCGDFVLKGMADLLKSVIRLEDILARWGGEEFLLLLPGIDLEDGKIVAERIRKIVETKLFPCREKMISTTLTLGMAELDEAAGVDASIQKADEALYKGKKMSKNCVAS